MLYLYMRIGDSAMSSVTELQHLKILVVHPRDREGDRLVREIHRIGCQVESIWPPPSQLSAGDDVVFHLIDQHTVRSLPWFNNKPNSAIVAVLERDPSSATSLLTDCSPHAVLRKPIDALDVLTSLVIAHSIFRYEERLHSKIRKLEETLKSIRKVEHAKTILMKTKNIDEKEAYEYLRRSAMDKRLPIGRVASAVIEADGVLN